MAQLARTKVDPSLQRRGPRYLTPNTKNTLGRIWRFQELEMRLSGLQYREIAKIA